MTHFIRNVCASLVVGQTVLLGASTGQDPDPLALLRGAAAARESVRSGYLEIEYLNVFKRDEKSSGTLTFEFERGRRTVTQVATEIFVKAGKMRKVEALGLDEAVKQGLAEKKLTRNRFGWDGQKLSHYWSPGAVQANYRRPAQSLPNYYFDPRVLGSDLYHSFSSTIESCLDLNEPRSIDLIGEERVGGRPAWHIKVINRFGAEFHHWVEERSPFRVLRVKYVSPDESAVLESTYDVSTNSPLPTSEIIRWYDKAGQVYRESQMRVTRAELNRPVSEKVGTLASLDVPPGMEVFDDTQGKRIGYWNGTGISPTKNEALQQNIEAVTGEAQGTGRGDWPWVVAATLLAAGGLGVVVWRYRKRAYRADGYALP